MKGIVQTTFIAAAFFLPFNLKAQELQNFEIVGRYFYGDSAGGPITGVCSDDSYLYLTENYDSLKIYAITESNLPSNLMGSCWAFEVDHLFQRGDYVIGTGIYTWHGFTLFDISDISAPAPIGHYGGSFVIAHPILRENLLYAAFWQDIADQRGLTIFDITDPDSVFLTDYYRTDQILPFDIDLYGDFAYVSDWIGNHPCEIFDVSDPYDIIEIGEMRLLAPGAVEVYGRHIFVGPSVDLDTGPIGIFSLENPAAPVLDLALNTCIFNSWSIEIVNGYAFIFDGLRAKILVMDIGGFQYPESLGVFVGFPNCCISQIAVNNDFIYYAAGDSGLYVLRYTGPMPINTGDANNSGAVNGIDVVYMVNYLRSPEPPPLPDPPERGDANGDCVVNGLDVVYLVNYLKGYGEKPIRAFCYGR